MDLKKKYLPRHRTLKYETKLEQFNAFTLAKQLCYIILFECLEVLELNMFMFNILG
jgi:hypothetical protein